MDYKAAREAAGLSITQLCRLTGYSKAHTINIQNGQHPSEAYKKAFENAISNKHLISDRVLPSSVFVDGKPRRASVLRKRRELKSTTETIGSIADRAQFILKDLKDLAKLAAKAESDAAIIVDSTGESLDPLPTNFDPTRAPIEDQNDLANYLCGVMIELLTAYNYHTMSSDQFEGVFVQMCKHVREEIARLHTKR